MKTYIYFIDGYKLQISEGDVLITIHPRSDKYQVVHTIEDEGNGLCIPSLLDSLDGAKWFLFQKAPNEIYPVTAILKIVNE